MSSPNANPTSPPMQSRASPAISINSNRSSPRIFEAASPDYYPSPSPRQDSVPGTTQPTPFQFPSPLLDNAPRTPHATPGSFFSYPDLNLNPNSPDHCISSPSYSPMTTPFPPPASRAQEQDRPRAIPLTWIRHHETAAGSATDIEGDVTGPGFTDYGPRRCAHDFERELRVGEACAQEGGDAVEEPRRGPPHAGYLRGGSPRFEGARVGRRGEVPRPGRGWLDVLGTQPLSEAVAVAIRRAGRKKRRYEVKMRRCEERMREQRVKERVLERWLRSGALEGLVVP